MHHICKEKRGMISPNAFTQHVYALHRLLLPPLREPAGGPQPAAGSPGPGPRQAGTASGTANPADTHTATVGGRAARSPPKCPEESKGLTAPNKQCSWPLGMAWKCTTYVYECHVPVTVGHDGLYESRAAGEAVLPVGTSGAVVADKHAPLHCWHQPTPLKRKQTL